MPCLLYLTYTDFYFPCMNKCISAHCFKILASLLFSNSELSSMAAFEVLFSGIVSFLLSLYAFLALIFSSSFFFQKCSAKQNFNIMNYKVVTTYKNEYCLLILLLLYLFKVSLFYFHAGDETYQDIFRDFSQMASNNPEKLNRFQQDSQKFWFFNFFFKKGRILNLVTS